MLSGLSQAICLVDRKGEAVSRVAERAVGVADRL